ncbi:MAG: hypothetical protein VKJ24_07590 [Synechococcales bacterium]|nr:hypothetical protein [Synechococcales bacterium]
MSPLTVAPAALAPIVFSPSVFFPIARFLTPTVVTATIAAVTVFSPAAIARSEAVPASPVPQRLAQAKNSIWRTIAPTSSGFSILMPGTPQQKQSSFRLSSGDQIVLYSLGSYRAQEKVLYAVFYGDLAGNQTPTGEMADRIMEEIAKDILSTMNAEITAQQTLALNGFPGYEMRIKSRAGEGTGRVRTFIVNRRLYVLMALTTQEKALSKSIDGFMRSFKLTWN